MARMNLASSGAWIGRCYTRLAGRPRPGAGTDLLAVLVAETRDYAIFTLDPQGRVASWNAGAERFKGYSSRQILTRHFSVFYPPEDIAAGKPERELEIAGAEGRLEDEGWRVRRDGTRFWAHVVITALRSPDGALLGFGKVTRDLTERRHADEAVRLAEQRFRRTFHDAPRGMVMTDAVSSSLLDINDAACEMLGYERDELLRLGAAAVISPQDVKHNADVRERILRGEIDRAHAEGRYRHRDGHLVDVSVSMSLVRGSFGEPRHFVTHIEDITQRKQAESALRRSEEQFRLTIDHAPIGIALVAPDGRYLRVNRALCEMTGYPEGHLLATTFQDITHPDDVDADVDRSRRLLAGEITGYEMEKRYFRPDGSTMWIMLSVSLVRDDAGEPVHFVSQIQDINERKRYENDLRDLADQDPLTGLLNRRALSQQIIRELDHQNRSGESIGFVMIDLDHFKYVNDSLGHRVGDQIIHAVAKVLTDRMRTSDTVARLGGDEFGILIPGPDRDTLERIAAELVTLIGGVRIETGGREISCSASIGVVLAARSGEYDEDALIAAADLAMYEAKDAGRGQFALYDPAAGGEIRASTRLDWSERIRTALETDGFVLHYQPIVDLSDGSTGRYEALIRLPGPDGELVMPGAFLHIAERYGLMPAIDRWVLRTVITSLADGTLPHGAVIALNVSARSLTDTGLLALVGSLLGEHGVLASQLIFEVTESAAITQLDTAKEFGRGLQHLGCGFALDDFGTGFGSFVHLKHLPYGYIKIDGEFIHGMRANPNDRVLVEALVSVAKGLHKHTIAEGVGDERTAELLRDLGVDFGQGYHFGRPAPMKNSPDATHA